MEFIEDFGLKFFVPPYYIFDTKFSPFDHDYVCKLTFTKFPKELDQDSVQVHSGTNHYIDKLSDNMTM